MLPYDTLSWKKAVQCCLQYIDETIFPSLPVTWSNRWRLLWSYAYGESLPKPNNTWIYQLKSLYFSSFFKWNRLMILVSLPRITFFSIRVQCTPAALRYSGCNRHILAVGLFRTLLDINVCNYSLLHCTTYKPIFFAHFLLYAVNS